MHYAFWVFCSFSSVWIGLNWFIHRIKHESSVDPLGHVKWILSVGGGFWERRNTAERGPDQIQLGVINVSEDARGRMGESLHCRDPFPLTGALSFWINPTTYRHIVKGLVSEGLIGTILARYKRTALLGSCCFNHSMPPFVLIKQTF